MTTTFHDKLDVIEHSLFQFWRRQNVNGFFLNLQTKTHGMIHSPMCHHLEGTEKECGTDGKNSLTKKKKVCSTSHHRLVLWAEDNDIQIEHCSDCNSSPSDI